MIIPKQNTPEWEEFRRFRIGASDAPVIMGVSPFSTPYVLWKEKVGMIIKKHTYGMDQGHLIEDAARLKFNTDYETITYPEVLVHPEINWMMASLDGLDKNKKVILEIKNANEEDHELVKKGIIPEKYYPQLQHQMKVCEYQDAYYYSCRGKDRIALKCYRDEEYIEKMLIKEKEFYECLMNFTPPNLSDRDIIEKSDEDWILLSEQWKNVTLQLKNLESLETDLRQQLIALANNQNCKGNGIKLVNVVRKGSVNYKKIINIHHIDTEMFREEPSSSWRITLEKNSSSA